MIEAVQSKLIANHVVPDIIGFQKHNPDVRKILFGLLIGLMLLLLMQEEGEIYLRGEATQRVTQHRSEQPASESLHGHGVHEKEKPAEHQQLQQQQIKIFPTLTPEQLVDLKAEWVVQERHVRSIKKKLPPNEFMETFPEGE